MPDRTLRAAVYGVGGLNSLATRLMLEKGVEIVAAINRPGPKVGRDLGEVAGLGRTLGVPIRDDPAALAECGADIAVVGIEDDLETNESVYRAILEAGVNAVSFSAYASYPWRIAPGFGERLDRVARANGVTLTVTGNQDFFMVHLGTLASGTCHRVDAIEYAGLTDVDGFGPETARTVFVGRTAEEYRDHAAARGEEPLSIFATFWDNVAADLGLHVTAYRQHTEPVIAVRDTRCACLDAVVAAGRIVGLVQRTETDTREGVALRGEYHIRVLETGESPYKAWRIRGEPGLAVHVDQTDFALTTAAQVVNRLPDVVNAPPGFVTLEQLPKLRYRARALGTYLA